jgi:hypothetical protein
MNKNPTNFVTYVLGKKHQSKKNVNNKPKYGH